MEEQHVPADIHPRANIRGWSFSSEIDESSIHPGTTVTLSPGHPEIILFFDSYPVLPGTEIRYRLLGYDVDWTVTRGRTAHYRRLAPGTYSFQVQSRMPRQSWPVESSVLAIQQRPFFYQTWYAYLLVSLVMIALAGQLLHQRDQLLKGQIGMVLEERNRIASECHDTLMAGFAAISWQLEATAKLFRDSTDSAGPAAQSFDLARSMVTHCQAEARRIIWDLRNSDAITNTLSHALADAISTHRLRDTIEMALAVQGDEIPISPGAVHHLVCIGQEAVTNAIRHSGASAVEVNLRYGSDSLHLSVRDNGRGFQYSDSAVRTGHFGIAVMEERARKLGATLRMTTSTGHGTEVAITVSFQRIHQPTFQQHHIVPWIGV
ncbi:MAG: hypothetical protein NVSMB62_05160 [Acidobacteriaceae bacterium]